MKCEKLKCQVEIQFLYSFRLPQPSYTFYLIRKTIRYSVIGLISWGAYKMLVPNTIHQVLSSASYSTFNWIQSSITNFSSKND